MSVSEAAAEDYLKGEIRYNNHNTFFVLKGCFSNQDSFDLSSYSLVVAACAVCLVHSRCCVSFTKLVIILKKSENQVVMFCMHTSVDNWRRISHHKSWTQLLTSIILVFIIWLRKLTHCDWLRAGQFIVNFNLHGQFIVFTICCHVINELSC